MNILMVSESYYHVDSRVKQEAELLACNGHNVSVIAIKLGKQPFYEKIGAIKVYSLPRIEIFKVGKQLINEKNNAVIKKYLALLLGIFGYGFEFIYFTIVSLFLSFFFLVTHKIHVVHTHNPPDTLFIIALFYKLYGKKFIYDHHDLSPDLFREKYKLNVRIIYNLLLLLEKISCRLADLIITTNDSYKKIEIKRHKVPENKIYVVRNGPDLKKIKISSPIMSIKKDGKIILCYLGAINIQDGVDNILKAIAKLIFNYNKKDFKLLVIGDGDYLFELKKLAKSLMIENYVIFTGLINDTKILNKYLSTADIFLDAAPLSFLNDNSTFIKHTEYMVYQKPVISFKLKESMHTLGDCGLFVEPNDTDKYAKTLHSLINDVKLRKKLGENAKKRIDMFSWQETSKILLEAYKDLN